VAKKKKEEVPVFALIEMPQWKSDILQAALRILRIPGRPVVIAVHDTEFTSDGENYTDTVTGTKISKKVANGSNSA
jgi:hypothetical protein